MMKPKFDDVIDYVKAGEDDPDIGKMLDLHPDGQELLKQARFICKMLQHQSESRDAGDTAADFGDVAAAFNQVADMAPSRSISERPASRTFYQGPLLGSRPDQPSALETLIEREGRRSEDLGTLEYVIEGEQVTFSYEPSKTAMKFFKGLAESDGIQIPARRYALFLPRTQPADEPVVIRVAHRMKNIPARKLNLIFMPESGPFVRLRTDSNGLLPMRLPEQPGTLRFVTPIPQLLRIQPKK